MWGGGGYGKLSFSLWMEMPYGRQSMVSFFFVGLDLMDGWVDWVDGWAVGLWLWLGGKVTVSYGSWLVGGKMNGMGGGLVEMRNSLFFFHFFIFFSQRAPFCWQWYDTGR